ncbi:MAG: BON domain-containing protein [Holosporales bacterium]|jgi:osmotically-inducible protein OsmY|nr:BON domain-containing protein [Holosporales bacterium]
MIKIKLAITLMGAVLLLSGCVPAAIVGGTALVGNTALRSTSGITGKMSDITIQSRINAKWAAYNINLNDRLNVFAKGGYALLIGYAKDEPQRDKALELARKVLPLNKIYNEIRVGSRQGAGRYSSDATITSKVSAAIFVKGKVRSFNYNVTTLDGTVYVIGATSDPQEMQMVIDLISHIKGVGRVVTYIRVIPDWVK